MSRKAWIIAALVVTAIAASLVAILTVNRVVHRRRVSRVEVSIDRTGLSVELTQIIESALRGYSIPEGAPFTEILFPPVAESSNYDVIVTDNATYTDRSAIVAFDPYVLIANRSAGQAPSVIPGSSLLELEAWFHSLDAGVWAPFVLAGDEPDVFAAFMVYLAGELLSESRFKELTAYLGRPADSSDSSVDSWIELLDPVVELVNRWKDAGHLPFNWTDWDWIALETAVREGGAAITFAPRSLRKSLDWEDAISLGIHRLPTGPARRGYRMIGQRLTVIPGTGPRSDALGLLWEALIAEEVQQKIESESPWSPVTGADKPINREHRDLVGWIGRADELLSIRESWIEHPLLKRLHIVLR